MFDKYVNELEKTKLVDLLSDSKLVELFNSLEYQDVNFSGTWKQLADIKQLPLLVRGILQNFSTFTMNGWVYELQGGRVFRYNADWSRQMQENESKFQTTRVQ